MSTGYYQLQYKIELELHHNSFLSSCYFDDLVRELAVLLREVVIHEIEFHQSGWWGASAKSLLTVKFGVRRGFNKKKDDILSIFKRKLIAKLRENRREAFLIKDKIQ
jgi:hypothetical protein